MTSPPKAGTRSISDQDILQIYRKCFPRGLPIKDDDVIYLALALLDSRS